jgi:hypothetical protein
MKNLILIFSLLIVFISKAQSKYSLANYPMKSDIWMGKMYEGSVYIGPKDGTSFDYNEDFLKKVDMKVVQSYLQQSFDEFRKSYGLSPVKLDVNLTKLCVVDAKNMNQFKPKFTNDDKSAKQFWDKIPVLCFSKVDTKKLDINKVIADSFFDYCVGMEDAMSILLDKTTKKYGLAMSYDKQDYGFYIVIKNK